MEERAAREGCEAREADADGGRGGRAEEEEEKIEEEANDEEEEAGLEEEEIAVDEEGGWILKESIEAGGRG